MAPIRAHGVFERAAVQSFLRRGVALGWAVVLCVSALALAQAPARQNPVDRVQARLARDVGRLGGSPRGIVKLLKLWRNWDRATTGKTAELLERLSKDRRLSPHGRVYVRTLLNKARTRLGDREAAVRGFDDLGFARHWRVIGPFDNEGKSGFAAKTPPEARLVEGPDLEASYPGRERPVKWRGYPADVVRDGYVSLDAVFRPHENVCGVAETTVRSERAQPLTLWVGAGGAVKVYWNGEEVLSDASYRLPSQDRSVALVGAHAGFNRLMLKVCVTSSAWGFYLRVGDARGGVAHGVSFDVTTNPPPRVQPGHGLSKLPKPPDAPLRALEREAKQRAGNGLADPDALEALARYLVYTGSDDPSERRAKQLAARAAELKPTVARLRLAAELAEERGEVMRFAARAEELWPKDPQVVLLRASVIRDGPVPEDALPLLETISLATEYGYRAVSMRAGILRDLGLAATAYSVLRQAVGPEPSTAAAIGDLADLAWSAGRKDEAIELRRRLLQVRYDDLGTRREVMLDALERAEQKEVLEHLEALRALEPASSYNLRQIAEVFDGLGRDDMALAIFRESLELAPEDAESWVAYAGQLLRAGHRRRAEESFRKALSYRPQDAETRELLEQIQRLEPRTRADEGYAVGPEQFLKERRSGQTYPLTVLRDLTVNTVFENGLGSSFRQIVVQVHDDEGARRQRVHSVQFDPDAQRVELRLARVFRLDGRVLSSADTYEEELSQPWYRLYYDTRAFVVVLPDLEPGDVVELRYRIDDVAHRNAFADYYGDLRHFQGSVPAQHVQYVLITPTSRNFYFNRPQLPDLRHTRRVRGTRRVDSFVAENVPAIHEEIGMPGLTEVSPYLHVSTYRSWAEVGRWYWGLIRDQLYADDALKRTVTDLVKGAPDTRTKVQRIHNWVVRNTRYVALEFGIHGFLPYRMPLVVQRGFGDCKDKASLMYTMMREAGIEARIALVRTRHNGAIGKLPASLAVFDHAIAYVPELDLYLDGTAEHSGTAELPAEDQGVMVLLVGPGGSQLTQTPVSGARKNRRSRTLRVRLSADGSAQVEGEEEVLGAEAAEYRDYYQASGTRSERFEEALRSLYPGLELISQSFESLEELERPVRFRYGARVPQLARWDGDELRLAPSVLGDLIRTLARSRSRRYPLDLGATRSYFERRTVQLPHGLRAASLPSGGEVASKFGRLRLRFELEGTKVVSRTEFEVTRDRVNPEDYPSFRRWVEQADLLLRQRIGIRRTEPQ